MRRVRRTTGRFVRAVWSRVLIQVLAVAVIGLAGCGSQIGAYTPLGVPTALTVEEEWHRLLVAAGRARWSIETLRPDSREFVAVRSDAKDPFIRDRITARVVVGVTFISVQTELYWGGSWSVARVACFTYGFGREKEIAGLLESGDPAETPPPVFLVQPPGHESSHLGME